MSAGIGVNLVLERSNLCVKSVVAGGAAAESGQIATGDILIAVNGVGCAGYSIEKVAPMIKGDIGSQIAITIIKNGTGERKLVNLVRGGSAASKFHQSATLVKNVVTAVSKPDPAKTAKSPEVGGIGARVDVIGNQRVFVHVDPAGPAGSQGLLCNGDVLKAVDGKPVASLTVADVNE